MRNSILSGTLDKVSQFDQLPILYSVLYGDIGIGYSFTSISVEPIER